MNRNAKRLSLAAAALVGALGASAPANAVFVAAVCQDLGCASGPIIVSDNQAGDNIPGTGAINFTVAAFGYSLVVNTSQSKPVIGGAAVPQLDLTFTATTPVGAPGGNIFLYASDTDFTFTTNPGFLLTLGGTSSGGSGSVNGRAWGGTSNTALLFSGANLLGASGALTGTSFSSGVAGDFAPVVSPYSLTIGVAITRTTGGTTTGDLNLQVSAVPEPSTWALMLMGPALIGLVARRRYKR
jgi:hypothetical protein